MSSEPGDELLDEIDEARERLREEARAAIGIVRDRETPPLQSGVAASGVGWYPLLALSLLVVVDEFQGHALLILGPELSRALGISRSSLAAILALKTLAVTLATLPMAAYVQRRPRRGLLSIVTAFCWSAMTLFTGFATNVWGMMAVLVADGTATGSVRTVHPPLLLDSYPAEVRVRALAFYRGADGIGNIVASLLVGALTAWLGFTWRGVFLVMGIICIVAAAFSVRLRDPGFGRWDSERVRQAVQRDAGNEGARLDDARTDLGFFEIVRRLLFIPSIRRILASNAALGMLLIPLYSYLFFFLDERWNMGPGARGLFFAVMPVFSIAALVLFAPRGEAAFREDPARLVRMAARLQGLGVVALAFAVFFPVFIGMVLLFGLAFACLAPVAPALNMTMLSVVPPRMRPHASALAGIFLAGVGGLGGLLVLNGLDQRFGTAGAIASIALPGIASALVLYGAAKTVNSDLDRMLDGIVEEEKLRSLTAQGGHVPMLACRHLEFSYGKTQVLFDVNFNVDEGQMVALLGTNGAGKSTLLRVISGLGLPSRGTVRFSGADVTYLDAERRLSIGMVHIEARRAIFDRLSVLDNLRVFGHSHGGDRGAVAQGIEASFEAFPSLYARRHQLGATLSGGEQQMLALAKALVLRPRLLMIDELSLGLAPKVVTELLDMVRAINATGTAVVLVEQSVNVALSLVEHAYFMEKGEIRFDGPASELLRRDDLLRSVMLEGAARALELDPLRSPGPESRL